VALVKIKSSSAFQVGSGGSAVTLQSKFCGAVSLITSHFKC